MLVNMREHLVALGEIQGALAEGRYDKVWVPLISVQ